MQNISFLFSGQGAQAPGMGKSLYDSSPASKAVFDLADQVLGRRISELCFSGTQEELNQTHNTQPCMLAVDLAAYAAIAEKGIHPAAIAGFSVGEYAALAAAGVITMEDAFRTIQLRADAMQEAVPMGEGAMAAVMNVSPREVAALCGEVSGYIVPANLNSPKQTVVSGETAAVDALLLLAKERKIRAVKLPVSAPFHCELMEPARVRLEKELQGIRFQDAAVPMYMNVDGAAHTDAEDIRRCVLRQTVSPVRWTDTICRMGMDIGGVFVELGTGKTLCGFVKKIQADAAALHVEDAETLSACIEEIRGRWEG